MVQASQLGSARNFARSLNILLKTVRLYGAEHERTASILGTAFDELRELLRTSGDTGLLLGVSGNQVLLDGVPLEKRPSDLSFAQLLAASGLSSINFSQQVTLEDFGRFVRAFSTRSTKAAPLANELRRAMGGNKGAIRINEVRFVPDDSNLSEAGMAAILAARSLGGDAQKLQAILQDPQRLLQLIGAAESARNQPVAPAVVPGAPSAVAPGQPAQEEDVFKVLNWLTQLGHTAGMPDSPNQMCAVEKGLEELPPPGQAALVQALMSLSSQTEPPRADDPLLLQLAERVAIRFALERYDRGDVKTNAVVELLDRLKREIGSLRTILKGHEEKMGNAGVDVESHAEILDRQFWASVPDKSKEKMLRSPEAWAVPPRNVRQFVEVLLERSEFNTAIAILENYARSVYSPGPEARCKAATGLTELADLFSRTRRSLLQSGLHCVGEALSREGNPDVQSLLGAAFVRFSHEAAARRHYPGVQEALQSMEMLEQSQPTLAKVLWPRVKVGNPLPEFIDEALRATNLPEGLSEVLQRMPQATLDELSSRLLGCARRDEWERMLGLVAAMGPPAVTYLSKTLQNRPAHEAAPKIALLSRLEPTILEEMLPERLRKWDPQAHDLVVRQLANGMAPQRGRLLELVYDNLNPNVLPEAVDEMGMSGDASIASRLMRIVEDQGSQQGVPYLKIKAIEALGRLRETRAEALLRQIAEAKRFWSWTHPRELRITAVQALKKIDPDWAKDFLPRCGLSEEDLKLTALDADPKTPWLRQRRYERVSLPRPIKGTVHMGQCEHPISIRLLSLGGGMAEAKCQIKSGSTVPMDFKTGASSIHTRVLVREARPQELSFELVEIDNNDRGRLRRPLVELLPKTHRAGMVQMAGASL
jgi:hypothetical protein